MKAKLRVKCRNCGNWNVLDVEKIFLNTGGSDSGLKVFLPAYLPLKTEKCSKCNQDSKGKENNRKKKSQIAKSVFARHYLKVEDVIELLRQVNAVAAAAIECRLLSKLFLLISETIQ